MITRSRVGIMAAVAVSVALAGCASVEDFTSNPEKQKTRQGTAIGAVGGAAVGLIAGGGWKGALIGAGVGALAGGLAGNYMDKQEAKLRQQMAGTGVEVVRIGDNLTLSMPGNVTFAFDSAKLNPQFDSVLDKLAQTLSEYNKTVIQIAAATPTT
jgi:outer membrane protein OmpA-like peptidoglycan-associated protein